MGTCLVFSKRIENPSVPQMGSTQCIRIHCIRMYALREVGMLKIQQMAETQRHLFANVEVTMSKNVYIVGLDLSEFWNEL